MGSSCIICNNSMSDEITLHYTSDGWDTPFRVCLCREHQRELIVPVQGSVRPPVTWQRAEQSDRRTPGRSGNVPGR